MWNVRIIGENYFISAFFITFPVGQKFTYTQLVLGSIAFKLFHLGQTFWVAFHKLPTISWGILAHSSWLSWCNCVRFVGLLARTLFITSAHTFSIGLRSGLCDGHSNTLTLLSLSLPQLWKYAWGHCPFGRPICNQALTSWLMSWDVASIYPLNFPPHDAIYFPHDAIYFVKCTNPSCSKAPRQHDAATPMLHGWDGVLRLASLPLLSPNITMVIMAKQFYFCFIRPEDISPKSMIFVPMCSCKP